VIAEHALLQSLHHLEMEKYLHAVFLLRKTACKYVEFNNFVSKYYHFPRRTTGYFNHEELNYFSALSVSQLPSTITSATTGLACNATNT
jgi:hypothetical protein